VIKCVKITQITDPLESNNQLLRKRKYSPEDGPHGPKHVVSEWKEIIKNFVAIDGPL
jgi:hypothetical protein